MTETKRLYDATQRGYRDIIRKILLLCSYLEKNSSKIRTDRNVARRTANLADPTLRLERWRYRLSKFKSDSVDCAEINRQAIDTLPRLHTADKDESQATAMLKRPHEYCDQDWNHKSALSK